MAREVTAAKKKEEHVGAFQAERHPSARLSRNPPHIGTFKPGRNSSARLSRNKLLKRKLVNAEKESISKTSEREFYFVSEEKSLTNINGTTSGKGNELAPLAEKSKCTWKEKFNEYDWHHQCKV